jgi:hypothetical protein
VPLGAGLGWQRLALTGHGKPWLKNEQGYSSVEKRQPQMQEALASVPSTAEGKKEKKNKKKLD